LVCSHILVSSDDSQSRKRSAHPKKKEAHPPVLDFDYPHSNQPHIPAPSRLLILTMSMMDSDLKKQAEKAALIGLAAPFLKVSQAICIDGTEDDDADDGAADNNADKDADVNADDDAATQMMNNNVDNNAAHRQWTTTQTTTP
jgi:hypothetical protein